MEVNLDAKDVNEYIAQAVLDSTLGKQIKKEIEEALKGAYSYDAPVKRVVQSEMNTLIHTMITEEYAPIIRKKVQRYVTDEILNDLTKKAWEAFMKRY